MNNTIAIMNASSATLPQDPDVPSHPTRWLMFIHQIPPKPDYFRVKVRRRLQRMGAVPLKNSVYLLPAREETMEDFQWLLREVRSEGGEATLCRAEVLDGIADAGIVALFRAERGADYAAIEREAAALGPDAGGEAEVGRLRRRLAEVGCIDFFGAPGRESAERTIGQAAARQEAFSEAVPTDRLPRGRTWVTRPGVGVDRMSSAWLIRRFIDPEARFEFAAPGDARAMPDVLRFDMFEGEFTHEGGAARSRCFSIASSWPRRPCGRWRRWCTTSTARRRSIYARRPRASPPWWTGSGSRCRTTRSGWLKERRCSRDSIAISRAPDGRARKGSIFRSRVAEDNTPEELMLNRALGAVALALLLTAGRAAAQNGAPAGNQPVSPEQQLSEWIADLKAAAPSIRNGAAYEIAGMGPAAASAVPALIEALDDPAPAVRFPVTVALAEIGPAAAAAVPRLKQMMEEDMNDEVAAAAKRAIRRIEPAALGR